MPASSCSKAPLLQLEQWRSVAAAGLPQDVHASAGCAYCDSKLLKDT
jgi:hypothetical protein